MKSPFSDSFFFFAECSGSGASACSRLYVDSLAVCGLSLSFRGAVAEHGDTRGIL